MFFIHGGGFSTGAGGEELYGPDFLLDEDVILVAGNYRLSALGFLSTFTEEFSGNYGLKDQVLMMKWVQQNIAAFGGDPRRVTIFGESAGAGSVGYHLLSPMSKGLFQQAALHSGSAFENWSNVSHAQSLQFAEKMFKAVGCEYSSGNYKATLACMRQKDVQELTTVLQQFMTLGEHPLVVFGPVKEVNSKTPFITEVDYVKETNGNDVPIIIGVTANEGALFMGMISAKEELMTQLENNFEALIPSLTFLFDRFENEAMKEKLQLTKKKFFNGANFNFATHKLELMEVSLSLIVFLFC